MIIRSRAPLRISLGGGGTDVSPYPEIKGGAVLSTTIDRYAYVTIKENHEDTIRIFSQDYNLIEIFEKISEIKNDGKLNLVKAGLNYLNVDERGIDITIHVDSPPGSGLGSSSALTVSLIGAINELKEISMDSTQIARTAIEIERNKAGIKGGKQDQYAAAFGGFNFIEFKKDDVFVHPLQLDKSIINEFFTSLILFDTRKTRLSANILDRQIKSYEERKSIVMESLDSLKDIAYEMKQCLLDGNIFDFGELMNKNWKMKQNLDDQITNNEIDSIYDAGINAGAIGGKLLGAGGGGHMLFLCEIDKRQNVINEVSKLGCNNIKFNLDNRGLQSWTVDNGKVI